MCKYSLDYRQKRNEAFQKILDQVPFFAFKSCTYAGVFIFWYEMAIKSPKFSFISMCQFIFRKQKHNVLRSIYKLKYRAHFFLYFAL